MKRKLYERVSFHKKSNKGDTFGFCGVCNFDISVGSGGKDDINKHTGGERHQIALKEGKPILPVTAFSGKSDDMKTNREKSNIVIS